MGLLNPRTHCPNCGAKIHTRTRLLYNPLRERALQTGRECPYCAVPLTGAVTLVGNRAVVDEERLPEWEARRRARDPTS